jgi:hypothetical protein
VINQIKGVRTGNSNGHGDVPVTPIVIEKAVLLGQE